MASSSDKKGIALIIAGMKPKKGSKPDEGDSDDSGSGYDEGLTATAEELLRAIKRGDADALTEALCSFIDQHGAAPANDNDDE